MNAMKEYIIREKFFDRSPIIRRRDPRHVRKVRRDTAWYWAKYWAKKYWPVLLDAALAGAATVGLIYVMGFLMIVFSCALHP